MLLPLSRQPMASLVRQRLGTSQVSPTLIRFLNSRSDGNPLIISELCYALLNTGILAYADDGSCVFQGGEDQLLQNLTIPAPHTVSGIITARLDRLVAKSPACVLLLKTAAILQVLQQTEIFSYGLLLDVFPLPEYRSALPQLIVHLESQRLIVRVDDNDDLHILASPDDESAPEVSARRRKIAFRFSHPFMSEVLRDSLTLAQSRLLIQRSQQAVERQEDRIRLRWLEATVGNCRHCF